MVPFPVDTVDELIRYLCSKFVLNVLEKSKTTTSLIRLNMLDRNILFLHEVKQFLVTFCNHLLTKSLINSHFARCCRSLTHYIWLNIQKLARNFLIKF